MEAKIARRDAEYWSLYLECRYALRRLECAQVCAYIEQTSSKRKSPEKTKAMQEVLELDTQCRRLTQELSEYTDLFIGPNQVHIIPYVPKHLCEAVLDVYQWVDPNRAKFYNIAPYDIWDSLRRGAQRVIPPYS